MNSNTEVLDFKNFRNLGVSGKIFSSLGKIGVCPEKFFDSQNGTLTEIFFGDGGGGGGRGRRKKFLRAPCSSVTLLDPKLASSMLKFQ